jgi:hypothetical protein
MVGRYRIVNLASGQVPGAGDGGAVRARDAGQPAAFRTGDAGHGEPDTEHAVRPGGCGCRPSGASSDEPGDDWTWTLRSAANRPILRMLGDGEVVVASQDASGGAARVRQLQARASAMGGDGGFGGGGVPKAWSALSPGHAATDRTWNDAGRRCGWTWDGLRTGAGHRAGCGLSQNGAGCWRAGRGWW